MLCVIDIVALISFPFWMKNREQRFTDGHFPAVFKAEPGPAVLAYKNREQLPVYTGLPKPRTINRLYG
jgi:hypothetical protein